MLIDETEAEIETNTNVIRSWLGQVNEKLEKQIDSIGCCGGMVRIIIPED